jgi:Predicted nucleic-acid-binding protein containing a Zn-ribbon
MTAKIYTYTVIRSSTEKFADKVPYVVAILEKENGERFTAFVDGYKDGMEIKIGSAVKCIGKDDAGRDIYSFS